MWLWFKKYWNTILIFSVTFALIIFMYSCEPKVSSLNQHNKLVTRQELQLELDQLISTAQIRMADLERQEQLRAIILQNALVLVQGQPLNPVGIITAVAALYGAGQLTSNVGKKVKKLRNNKRTSNGTG